MRFPIILLSVILLFACASKKPQEGDKAEIITRVGMIAAREDVSMDDVERDTRSSTSVYGSVSSGSSGSGMSIGIGVLLSSIGSGGSDPEPVRYEVNLIEGGQMTIYHDSRDFEVGDCVQITIHPDEKKHPPTMRRKESGC
ncbi:MAG: hypothetical protein JSU67_00825 [Gammaproteobacteria bacterium]|nr:MAG: hypothetical protein JSU67_00825 [Gammaproteobacteria bacterium]